MKKMTRGIAAFAAASAVVLAGCSSSEGETDETTSPDATNTAGGEATAAAQDVKLWLMGTDTPDELIQYLKDTYAADNGGTLTVEQIGWGDAISSLTTSLPDSANTPDVTEVGNTQAATFTTVGAFMDITDMYEELGGDDLLQGFVEAGSVGDTVYALPYYFGSRMVWYRKDLYAEGGVDVPTTLAEVTEVNASLKEQEIAGAYVPGQDWRDGISWIFANGGDIATFDGSQWASALSSDESVEGMKQWQELFTTASVASVTDDDSSAYQAINDDFLPGLPAATTMAPNWAFWSLGDLSENDEGEQVATWNDETFGAYVLPGVDGGVAPVFAGGSNIGISAATQNVEGAKQLMQIIFSDDYQLMLAENGLGPANTTFGETYAEVAAMGDLSLQAAESAKLTPAAPGWASIEEQQILEQYFAAVAEGGDVASLAVEYDEKINSLING
ncbi:extracellular solute-binding protein [Demequina sp. B12]|uniref:extracellular solute-binding protein n=1 Tax=Demequina sp. B12 TaxID=2992757 RepID=UPI00237A6D1D|nr:extracellular solute-binding protein [Demequina sp. B12]MDE0572529.1 extracellular solute-binding protein [Demequina sp. B12]